MPALQTPAALALLKTKLHTTFRDSQKAAGVYSKELFTEVPSDTEFNTYDWLAEQSGMREWIGPRAYEGLKERHFAIYNKPYEKTLEVDAHKLEDSPMTAIGSAAARLAIFMTAAIKLQDDLATDLLQNGQTRLCYDGQYFFDTDHPIDLDSTGTQSNYEASGFALTGPNFNTARARMFSYKNEGGRPLTNGGIFVLRVPPALESAANTIVTAEYGSSGATNVNKGQAVVQVVPELAGQDTTWYLTREGGAGPKALILQLRSALNLVALTRPEDAPVFERHKYVWGIDMRVGAGYGMWANAFKGVA